MNLSKVSLAAALALSTAQALASVGFDQLHFGIRPETRMLVVKVRADRPVWKLWPEDVKIEHTSGRMDYIFSYSAHSGPKAVLSSASSDKNISTPCQDEAKLLMKEPAALPAEENLITTLYVPVEEKHQERLTVNAGEGMRILDAQPLQSSGAQESISAGISEFSRAVAVEVEYMAGWSLDYGPSDIRISPMETAGRFKIDVSREGLAAVVEYNKQKLLSDSCYQEITKLYSGPEEDKTEPKSRKAKQVKTVLTLDGIQVDKLQFIGAAGFKVKKLEVLE